MGYSLEKYLGAYLKIPKGLDLMKAVYDWEEKISEDRFVDAWRENRESPSIWISNYIVDNSIREEDEYFEISLEDLDLAQVTIVNRFKEQFRDELKLLDEHDIYYEVKYGFISYVS